MTDELGILPKRVRSNAVGTRANPLQTATIPELELNRRGSPS